VDACNRMGDCGCTQQSEGRKGRVILLSSLTAIQENFFRTGVVGDCQGTMFLRLSKHPSGFSDQEIREKPRLTRAKRRKASGLPHSNLRATKSQFS
jgi:hypothetical protein